MHTEYFVTGGNISTTLRKYTNTSIGNCLFTEQYLHLSVSNACKCLDGFDRLCMDPIDYISSNDMKNKFVDLCRGGNVVATINLTTGEITKLSPELKMADDKNPVDKQLVIIAT